MRQRKRSGVWFLAFSSLFCACANEAALVQTSGSNDSQESSDDTNTDSGGTSSSDEWPIDPTTKLRISSMPPLPPLDQWPGDPETAEKRELGRTLFYDARLSSSKTTTCGSCHSPFADMQSNTPRDLPARSHPNYTPNLPRHTPSLLNIAYAGQLHWDGAESDLIESMVRPFAEPNMNLTDLPADDVWTLDVPLAKERLHRLLSQEMPQYIDLFQAAFDSDISQLRAEETWLLAGRAMAHFIRPATTGDSVFDQWNRGEDMELSVQAQNGLRIFLGKGKCIECHDGAMLSDFEYHNLSLLEIADGNVVDPGRAHVTHEDADIGKFLTPPLRRVTRTSPYFHAGTHASLSAVIEHHTNGKAVEDAQHDAILDEAQSLSKGEIDDLIELLRTFEGAALVTKEWMPPKQFPNEDASLLR